MSTKQRRIVSHSDEIQTALDEARSSTKCLSNTIYKLHGPILGPELNKVDEAAARAHEALCRISIDDARKPADRTLSGEEHFEAVRHALENMRECLPTMQELGLFPNVSKTIADVQRLLETFEYYTEPADDAPETANALPTSFTREDLLQHLRETRCESQDATGMGQTHPVSSTRTPFAEAMIEAGKDQELTVAEAARITGLNKRVISSAVGRGKIASNGKKGQSCRVKLESAVEFADSYKPKTSKAAANRPESKTGEESEAAEPSDLISISQASKKYEATHTTIQTYVREGKIKSYRSPSGPPNRKHRVSESDVRKYFDLRPTQLRNSGSLGPK